MVPVSVDVSSSGGVGDDVGSDAEVSTGTTFAFYRSGRKAFLMNTFLWTVLCVRSCDGLLVVLAFVRQ